MRTRPGQLRLTFDCLLTVETDLCVPWPHGLFDSGYGQMQWDGKTRRVHQLACEHHHGPKPFPEAVVAHSCRNRHCMNYRHLRWDTLAGNFADKIKDGTHARGEQNGVAKLTEPQVREIRARYAKGGVTQADLAAEYGTCGANISFIITRRAWAWVE